MDEKKIEKNDELEIDLQRIIRELLNKSWLIAIVAVACAVVVLLGTILFVTPQYQSSAMFYVNNSSFSLGDAAVSLSSSDISASRGLVESYIIILTTRETLNDVIDYAGVDRTYGELKGMVSAEAVDSTEIFRVTVTSPDPYEAQEIAEAITYILPKRIASIVEGTSANIVDSAVVPSSPSSPSYTKNALFGFLVGFIVSAAVIVLQVILDITIRSEDDVSQCSTSPVLVAVPDMEAHSKGGYYYGYGNQKDSTKPGGKTEMVGGNISFAAAEAYKMLRTKLQFSFVDGGECHIIGVSSALAGEGKSLTSVNLAYTMSQLGKRVLLIDCDMRRPSISEKLPIRKTPGLSEFLSGQSGPEHVFQLCGIKDDERAFHAISSGRIPPNPMELLGSNRMAKMLDRLRANYDYIILDLPPVGEVGDALAVAKFTDGMLLVVRQNYCNRAVLNSAVRQFEFVDAKILGVVLNCASDETKGYSKRYYKKYYRDAYKKANSQATSRNKSKSPAGKRV